MERIIGNLKWENKYLHIWQHCSIATFLKLLSEYVYINPRIISNLK